jgi:adenylate cyclase
VRHIRSPLRQIRLPPKLSTSRGICNWGMSEVLRFGRIEIRPALRQLRVDGRPIVLGSRAFDVMMALIERRDRLVSKAELLDAVWPGVVVEENNLSVQISALRRALGPQAIATVTGRGYRFTDPTATSSPAAIHHSPSVAVLPFTNLSGDAQDYLSDGLAEDIITELSRFSELLVIARNSAFQYKGKAVDIRQVGQELGARYVLEGSVRRDDNRVRIAAQLIDAVTGAHLWAERYDREVRDVLAVQDEVARMIVTILAAHVNRAEIERTLLKPPVAWEAYECYLRGAEALILHQNRRTKASLYEARRLLEQSLAIDAGYARAAAVLSWTHLNAYLEPFDGDHLSPAALDRALEWAEAAVHLDPRLPNARAQLGYVLLFKRQHDAAMAEFERANALNPNFIDYRYARALLYTGAPERAIEVLQANTRLDPFQPLMYATSWMGQANYMLGNYADAVRLLREFTARRPNIQLPYLWLAAAHARLGQHDEAREDAAEVLRINSGFTIDGWKRLAVFKDPQDVDHLIDGLRKAGLPET